MHALRRLPPLAVDSALAAVFVVVSQVELHHHVDDGYQAGPMWLNLPLVVLMAGPLATRRLQPTWSLLVMLAAACLPGPFLAHTIFFWGSLVPMAVVTYSLARHRDHVGARHAWLVGPVVLAANMPHVAELRTPSNIFFAGGLFGIAWLVGRVLHRLSEKDEALRAALARIAADQPLLAEAAVDTERRRIAAEMHDVVAHAVSLMTMQVGAARLQLDTGGVAVPPQLLAAEETGREAVAELRRTLGVMSASAARGMRQPMPDLAGLQVLADRFVESGLRIDLTVQAEHDLPASVQLAAYRIVQEALTNALKHAGDVAVAVTVRRTGVRLEVEVVNAPGRGGGGDAGGHGLIGMRERVAMFGGQLTAGPSESGGFRVAAELPVAVPAVRVPG
jgi:signal transduction histidine kinase